MTAAPAKTISMAQTEAKTGRRIKNSANMKNQPLAVSDWQWFLATYPHPTEHSRGSCQTPIGKCFFRQLSEFSDDTLSWPLRAQRLTLRNHWHPIHQKLGS